MYDWIPHYHAVRAMCSIIHFCVYVNEKSQVSNSVLLNLYSVLVYMATMLFVWRRNNKKCVCLVSCLSLQGMSS